MTSRDALRAVQEKRLLDTVEKMYAHVAPYRKKMDEIGLLPGDIKSLDDLYKLPFTQKQDLRDAYPFGLFAVPMSEIVRVHASSGTTGKQTVVGYTRKDIESWSHIVARAYAAGGVTREDIGHISYGYGLFTGGLGAHWGCERIGAATVPVSTGNTKRQIQIMRDFGCTFICCTPSYALYLAETMEEMGVDMDKDIKLRRGFFGAEPWTEAMRAEIERRLHIKAFDIYGLSEVMGPGVAFECENQGGLHINEDHFIPEIVDPVTGKPLPDGEEGELVFSCVTKEALPLLRYRTHDVTSFVTEECACGRVFRRMKKPTGRTDDMLIIRGVNVFPTQVESVLLEMGQVSPYYQLVVDRKGNLDTLEILVEMGDDMLIDNIRAIEDLQNAIRRNVESTLGIAARIRLVEPHSIERVEGKAKHIIDKRAL